MLKRAVFLGVTMCCCGKVSTPHYLLAGGVAKHAALRVGEEHSPRRYLAAKCRLVNQKDSPEDGTGLPDLGGPWPMVSRRSLRSGPLKRRSKIEEAPR